MISSSEGRSRALRRRGVLASLFAVAAVVAVFGAAGTASASKANCAGSVAPDPEAAGTDTDGFGATYSFFCDQNVLAYSLSLTKQVILFDPEVLPTLPTGEASGELASCEGPVPGSGIGCTAQSSKCPGATSSSTECTGQIAIGNTVTSSFETSKPYCPTTKKQHTLETFLTVTTIETTAAGKTFINASQPFHLDNGLGCTKPTKSRH